MSENTNTTSYETVMSHIQSYVSTSNSLKIIEQSSVEQNVEDTSLWSAEDLMYVSSTDGYTPFAELCSNLSEDMLQTVWTEPLQNSLLVFGSRDRTECKLFDIPQQLVSFLQDTIRDVKYFYKQTSLDEYIDISIEDAVSISHHSDGSLSLKVHQSALPTTTDVYSPHTYNIRSICLPRMLSIYTVESVVNESFVELSLMLTEQDYPHIEDCRASILQKCLSQIQFTCPVCGDHNRLVFSDENLMCFFCSFCANMLTVDSADDCKLYLSEDFTATDSLQSIVSDLQDKLRVLPEDQLNTNYWDINKVIPSEDQVKAPFEQDKNRHIWIDTSSDTITTHILYKGLHIETSDNREITFSSGKFDLYHCASCSERFPTNTEITVQYTQELGTAFDDSIYTISWQNLPICQQCMEQAVAGVNEHIHNSVDISEIMSRNI